MLSKYDTVSIIRIVYKCVSVYNPCIVHTCRTFLSLPSTFVEPESASSSPSSDEDIDLNESSNVA